MAYIVSIIQTSYNEATIITKGGTMRVVYRIALVLVIIGGLNWGLVGFFDYNLVDGLFGEGSVVSRVVYALVGLSALLVAVEKLMVASKQK